LGSSWGWRGIPITSRQSRRRYCCISSIVAACCLLELWTFVIKSSWAFTLIRRAVTSCLASLSASIFLSYLSERKDWACSIFSQRVVTSRRAEFTESISSLISRRILGKKISFPDIF
jgi:hypothetical protein